MFLAGSLNLARIIEGVIFKYLDLSLKLSIAIGSSYSKSIDVTLLRVAAGATCHTKAAK